MINSHISLTEFASRFEAKVISGIMIFSIAVSQTLLPYTAYAALDLPSPIFNNPATSPNYTQLIKANTEMAGVLGQLNTASSTLININKQFDTAQAGVLNMALKQGLAAQDVSTKQITDASKILPEDALILAKTMINQAVSAGVLSATQLKNGAEFDDADAEALVIGALTDTQSMFGWNIQAALNDEVTCTGGGDRDNSQPIVCTPSAEEMEAIIERGVRALQNATTSVLSVASAKNVIVAGVYNYKLIADPVTCTGGGGGGGDGDGPQPVVCTLTQAETDAAIASFTSKISSGAILTAIQKTVTNSLASELIGATGLLDETTYKTVFANTMINVVGTGNSDALKNSLGAPTLNAFQGAVKNAIHADILNQVEIISDGIVSPFAMDKALDSAIGNPARLLQSLISQSVEDSISRGAVSLTQLKDLGSLSSVDLQNIIENALADTGRIATPGELTQILSGSLGQFSTFRGVADIADIKSLVGGQISNVLGVNPSSLSILNTQNIVSGALSDTGLAGSVTVGQLNQIVSGSIGQFAAFGGATSIAGIKNIVGGQIAGVLGMNPATLISQMGTDTFAGIGNSVASQMGGGTLSSLQGAIENVMTDNVLAQVGSLTWTTDLAKVGVPDVQSIVSSALSDTGLLGSITPMQLNQIVSGSLGQFSTFNGMADIADIKGLVGGQIGNVLGVDPASLISQMGGETLSSIQGTVSSFTGSFNLSQVQDTIAGSIFSTTGMGNLGSISSIVDGLPASVQRFTPENIQALSVASNAVNDAIASGAVSPTQLTDLKAMEVLDIQNIVNGVLSDNGLTVSTNQLNRILSGASDQFLSFDGVAKIADVKSLIGGEIGTVLGRDPALLISQMGLGTLNSIEGSFASVMTGNVISQMSSLTGALNPAQLQSTIASSILSTTGIGNLGSISSLVGGIPDLTRSLTSIQGGVQGIINGQLGQLTGALGATNVQTLISSQIAGLTGLGNPAAIFSSISPNLGQAFASISQIGGQLDSITAQFGGAFGNVSLGLNSLTESFNSQLSGLSPLSQLNLSGLSGSIGSLSGGLVGQIAGPLSGMMGNLSGVAGNIMGNGVASVADLTGLSGALSVVTNQITSAVSSATGVTSLSSSVPGASGMIQLPFGGKITRSRPCTCTPGFPFLITMDKNYAGGASKLMYMPGRSTLFPLYQVFRRGPMIIGLHSPVPMACMVYVGVKCKNRGTGQIITMVGTSR